MSEDLGSLKDCYVTQENGKRALAITGGGVPLDTLEQDNTAPWNDFYFAQLLSTVPAFLTSDAVVGSRVINVNSIAELSIGGWAGIFSGVTGLERYYFSEIQSINLLAVTLDVPVDFPFTTSDAVVVCFTKDMNVDGSVTPQKFAIQAGSPAGNLKIDITRLMMACETLDPVDLSKFCDIIGGLSNGFLLREKENGTFRNKINFKTNFDFSKFAFDWVVFSAQNPQQGQNGFSWRFTLSGQDKHGAVTRVDSNINTLEWLIQDDLTTITKFQCIASNHEVLE